MSDPTKCFRCGGRGRTRSIPDQPCVECGGNGEAARLSALSPEGSAEREKHAQKMRADLAAGLRDCYDRALALGVDPWGSMAVLALVMAQRPSRRDPHEDDTSTEPRKVADWALARVSSPDRIAAALAWLNAYPGELHPDSPVVTLINLCRAAPSGGVGGAVPDSGLAGPYLVIDRDDGRVVADCETLAEAQAGLDLLVPHAPAGTYALAKISRGNSLKHLESSEPEKA